MFLLATGERGLGWDAVSRMTLHEFETCWMIQQAVLTAADEDARKSRAQTRAVERAIDLERWPSAPMPAVTLDPERMTTAELEQWIHQMGAGDGRRN